MEVGLLLREGRILLVEARLRGRMEERSEEERRGQAGQGMREAEL
jgi:hypothetical protein